MQYITRISFALFILALSVKTFAQAPQAFSYQAVVRSTSNVVTNAQVGIYYIIHDGSPIGNSVYEESQTVVTNQYGLFVTTVGAGTVQSGNFSTINWASGPKYLEVLIDITGGTNYSPMATTQLVSVPYALYANKADTANYIDNTPEFAVYEERYGNGISANQPVSNTWNSSNFNYEQSSSGTSISRSGSIITLTPGTYHVRLVGNTHMRGNTTSWCSYNVRLKNLTTSQVALQGYTSENYVNINYSQYLNSSAEGYLTINTAQNFTVEYWYWAQNAPVVISNNTSDPSEEIYGRIVIEKVK